MKSKKVNLKGFPFKSKALFTIVGGAVLINPAFAQDNAASGGDELEEIVVTGLRGSLKASMEVKRDALGVVDAISAEDIGKFPDTNLAESLQRITGISIDRRNGEGALVTARGFGPQYNMVTLNGRQVPGAEGFSNGDITTGGAGAGARSFNFAQLASESISAVEVYKTGRADIASGGIGATVNIKTARPFDNDGLVLNLGAKGVYDESAPFDNDITPEASGIFSFANDDKTWGVGLSASYQKRHGGSVQSTVNAWNQQRWTGTDPALRAGVTAENAPEIGQLYALPNDIRYAFSDFERERINAQGVVQFAPTDALTFTVDYTYGQNDISEDRGEQTIWLQRSNSLTDLVFDTSGASATPTFLRDVIVGGKDFGFEQQHNEQRNTLSSVGFNANWKITDSFTLGLDAHDSKTKSLPNDPVTGGSATFVSVAGTNCVAQNPFTASAALSCPGAWAQEFTFNNGLPIASRTYFPTGADALAGTNGVQNADFSANQIASQRLRVWYTRQETEVKEARLDGTLEFDNGRFQFGVDTRKVEMGLKTTNNEVPLGDWSASDAGLVPGMMELLQPFSLTGLFDDFSTNGAPSGAWRGNADDLARWAMTSGMVHPTTGRAYNLWDPGSTIGLQPGELRYDPVLDANNDVEEKVNAAYIQFALKGELGGMPTNTLLGVRYETTDVTSTSQIAIPTAIVWNANNDFNLQRSADVQPFSEDAEYSHVLPNLDFDIGFTDTLKGRLSYSQTIARAPYTNLTAGPTPGNPTGSILINPSTRASGNAQTPSLVPLQSNNLDISLEWYFSDAGYLSGGFWEKRVRNFIGNTVVRQPLYGLTDPTSGPDAQAALAFLTSPQCISQVSAAGNDTDANCSANDTALFTAVAMLRNAGATGGLAAYDGSQTLAMENAYDLVGEADDPEYQYDVNRPANQEDARIHGFEFGGQYFFGETGLGVMANYTVVRGDVNFDDTVIERDQFALLGLSDTANVVLMYEKFGFTGRLAYNWRDEFLAATNQNGSNRNPYYVEAYHQFDLSLGYDFNEHLSLSLEGINITGEDIRWHGRSKKQMVRLEDQSPRYAFGVRYKF